MATLSPEPTSQPEQQPKRAAHHTRKAAESFGSDPARYHRTRPSYPEAMVQAIVAASPGRDVLDVGIGTGIAARQFQAAGCQVLGLDVDARMAEFARWHGFEVEVSTFEAWKPVGRTFDAIVCGQAWHWIDPRAGAAKAVEALRPGGRLALFWNVFRPPPAVAQAFSEVHRRVLSGPLADMWANPATDTYAPVVNLAADGLRQSGAFDDPEQWPFDWEQVYTRDEWLDQLPTHGRYIELTPAEHEELLAGIGSAIDTLGGTIAMGYTAVVVTATRTSGA